MHDAVMAGGDEVIVAVQSLGGGAMRVTLPGSHWRRDAHNVQALGMAVRDAHGWAKARHRTPYNDGLPQERVLPPPRMSLQEMRCADCGKRWWRRKRPGNKPQFCDDCHPVNLPHLPRVPQEVSRV